MDLVISISKLVVPESLGTACAEVPRFAASMRLVRLARWWNVWIGGGVAVVAFVLTGMSVILLRAGGGANAKRYLFMFGSALVFAAGLLVWRVGRRLPALVASTPVQLRPKLALAGALNALLLIPLVVYLVIWVLDSAGVIVGPGMPLHVTLITFAALATPAVGVFANGYPWLRLGRAFDNAVVGYLPDET